MHPLRSFLFAPGNHPRKVEKVFQVGADVVILDLEDAVTIAEKTGDARNHCRGAKKTPPRPRLHQGQQPRYRVRLG